MLAFPEPIVSLDILNEKPCYGHGLMRICITVINVIDRSLEALTLIHCVC